MQIIRCKGKGCLGGIFLLVFLVSPSFAQEGGEARVYFAEGGEFVLAAGGHRTVYQPDSIGVDGFLLHQGDILQTGPGGFVEIRLISHAMVLKIAENTSVSYETGKDGVSLGLSYGRIMLSTGGNGASKEPVRVRPGTSEVVFRQGDMGVDYTIPAGTEVARKEPLLRVYVFSGSADLIPHIKTPSADGMEAGERGPVFPVHEREIVSLEILNALSYVERKTLDQEMINYWNRHKPVEALFLPPDLPDSAPADNAAAPGSRRIVTVPPDYGPFFKTNTVKNGFIFAGAALSLLGIGMESLAWYKDFDNQNTNGVLMNTGYGFFGLGLLSLGAAFFISPKIPVSNGAE
ncbi:MAG: FecR family protein [Treponema sp.]|jgi:hypothetical protein|nr:FecR family protein [Treponema sp.]